MLLYAWWKLLYSGILPITKDDGIGNSNGTRSITCRQKRSTHNEWVLHSCEKLGVGVAVATSGQSQKTTNLNQAYGIGTEVGVCCLVELMKQRQIKLV
jgi:hypothetical protein